MDKYFEKIEALVFKEKYTVRPIHLIDLFGLHIKQAQFLLECFAEQHQNLLVKYGLTGHQGEPDDEIGARRYIVVEKDEIESEKKNFSKLVSCTIKSIKEKENRLNLEHENAHDLIASKDDLIKYQKKGYIVNEKTAIRTDKLEALLRRMGVSKDGLKNERLKPTNAVSAKPKTPVKEVIKAIKVDAKPKSNIFSSFKAAAARPKDQPKEELKVNDIVARNEEPNKNGDVEQDEEEEFVKLKNGKSKELKSKEKKEKKKFSRVMKALADSSEDEMEEDEIDEVDMSDQEEQVYKRRSGSQQIKRLKMLESDSDEELVHSKENIKHKSKKQKRKKVAVYSEDSSNDEQPAVAEPKFRPPQEEASSELVEEQETYIDEEGFKVTRTVKKIIKEEKQKETPAKLANDKQESNPVNKTIKTEKAKAKAETSPPTESKKSAPKSKQLPKNQTSIMSFFKPKTQSN